MECTYCGNNTYWNGSSCAGCPASHPSKALSSATGSNDITNCYAACAAAVNTANCTVTRTSGATVNNPAPCAYSYQCSAGYYNALHNSSGPANTLTCSQCTNSPSNAQSNGWTHTGASNSATGCAITITACNTGYGQSNNGTASATCIANTIAIAYDGNGGTGTIADGSCVYNGAYSLDPNNAVPPAISLANHSFAGWTKTSSATDALLSNSGSCSTIGSSGTVTIYAQYSYSITYNGNGNTGGTAPASASGRKGVAYTTAQRGGLVRTGHIFTGWNTQPDGSGASYTAGADIQAGYTGGNVTLYAQWSACASCAPTGGATCSLSVTNNVCTYDTNCSAGFGPISGDGQSNASCPACLAGTSKATVGKGGCANCGAGRYQPNTGQTACIDCPAGYYCPTAAMASVPANNKCGPGYYCPAGSTTNTGKPVTTPISAACNVSPMPAGYPKCGVNLDCQCLPSAMCLGGDTTCAGVGSCPSNTVYNPNGPGTGKANCYIPKNAVFKDSNNGEVKFWQFFHATEPNDGTADGPVCYYNPPPG